MLRSTLHMYRITRRAALCATAGILAGGLAGLAAPTPARARAGASLRMAPGYQDGSTPVLVEIAVLQNPNPFAADGRVHLLYELHLTNFQRAPLTLSAIDLDMTRGELAMTRHFEGPELAGMIVPVGVSPPASGPLTLMPGARNIAFIGVSFDSADQVPTAIGHALRFEPMEAGQPAGVSRLPKMDVVPLDLTVVGPPVYGDRWIAANAASNTSQHRRTSLVINGRSYFAQRYAIDLVQIGEDGRGYTGDPSRNENWHCYGKELLAVADGVVAATHDGVPDNVPLSWASYPITFETVAGNYAVIDLGDGRSADYAHMIPGTLKVKKGDRVRRGDVVGLLGNSGNSTAPHLHFHLTDRPSFIEANGIPYLFERVRVQKARFVSLGDFDFKIEILDPTVREATRELVLEDDLIGFDGP